MKAMKINPATHSIEYANMTDAEILRFVGGYIVELTDLNNGLAVHSDLMASGAGFRIGDKKFYGKCVMTGISYYGQTLDYTPDNPYPMIEWN